MTIKTINDKKPGVRRPLRMSDIQDLWNALNICFASSSELRILSGFDLQKDDSYSSGVLSYNGQLYAYDSSKGKIYSDDDVYAIRRESSDIRTLADGTSLPFTYTNYVSSADTDGEYIGIFDGQLEQQRYGRPKNIHINELDSYLTNLLNTLSAPRKVNNFDANPNTRNTLTPSINSGTPQLGTTIPVYADAATTGNPFPSENVTGTLVIGNYYGSDNNSRNYMYIVYSTGADNGGNEDVMAVRRFNKDGVPTDWKYMGRNPLRRVFNGNVIFVTSVVNGVGVAGDLSVTLNENINNNDTILVRGYYSDNGEYSVNFSAIFRKSDSLEGKYEILNMYPTQSTSKGISVYKINNSTPNVLRLQITPSGGEEYHITEVYKILN